MTQTDANTPAAIAPRAPRDAIATKITPEKAFYFSKAAYDNASRLVDAALLLHANGHYGPARSMAISAREEFGKFFAALLNCGGVYSSQDLAGLLRRHSSKQTLGATLALLGGPLKAISERLASAVQVKTATLREAFDLMAANLQAVVDDIPMPDEQAISAMQAKLTRAHSGGDDARRTEGLYVDLMDAGADLEIRSPNDVSAADALEEIETARAYVLWTKPLVEAISIGDLHEDTEVTVQDVIAGLRHLASLVAVKRPDGGS